MTFYKYSTLPSGKFHWGWGVWRKGEKVGLRFFNVLLKKVCLCLLAITLRLGWPVDGLVSGVLEGSGI